MNKIVKNVKSLWTYHRKARIDNTVFTLHKITAGILLFLSLLISTAFLLKDPIECINDKTIDHVVNAYCWIHATYTIPSKLNSERGVASVAHPGVATFDPLKDDIRVHKFYQWVCFVLFIQAITFYAPRWLWKQWEEGHVKFLTSELVDLSADEESREKRKEDVQNYFCNVMGYNDGYSMKYAFCELLNFVNVVIQIDLTDRFVGRAFSTYGIKALIQSNWQRQDPMFRTDPLAIVFPTVSKCTLNMVGPSGNIVPYDALCVLPWNMYNEKFYPLLFVWFIFLAVVSGLALVYRLVTFLFPEIRFQLLRKKFSISDDDHDNIWELNRKLHYGDWFLLYQIGKNMGQHIRQEFLEGIAKIVKNKRANGKGIDEVDIDSAK